LEISHENQGSGRAGLILRHGPRFGRSRHGLALGAHQVRGLPAVGGEAIIWLSIAVWVGLTILYIAKWFVARDNASAEVADPVQCCFVGLIGVATMLVAGGIQPYSPALAVILFTAAAAFAVGFAVWRTGGLWQGEREHAATTAVLYLPSVAGVFVTAITAAALGYADWGQVIFGGGLFSWLAIESVLLGRMLTGPELAAALRPTLGIQLAPAPVGAVAYLSVTQGPPDVFAHALIGYGVLQLLILLRLLPWIGAGGFTPSYWAFTFGITALATVPLKLLARGDSGAIADALGKEVGVATKNGRITRRRVGCGGTGGQPVSSCVGGGVEAWIGQIIGSTVTQTLLLALHACAGSSLKWFTTRHCSDASGTGGVTTKVPFGRIAGWIASENVPGG
jgi:tellurite resistance protein